MRKVWISVRKGIPGSYVEWYDDLNRRRSKYFSPKNKQFVKSFQTRKFIELNQDIRPIGYVVDLSWSDLVGQYLNDKKAEGLAESSLIDIRLTCDIFERLCQPQRTKLINRAMLQKFLASLRSEKSKRTSRLASPHTINKHLRNLRALFSWGAKYNYLPASLEIKNVKVNIASKRQNARKIKSQVLIPISQLIVQGEGPTIEFKETLEYSVRETKQDTNLNKECLKTIAAFLNTDGGTLLIGVRDNGEITGIERDLPYVQRKNVDGFQVKLRNLIESNFTPFPSGKVNISFENLTKETVCRVDVEPINKNQIINLGKDVYIRDGNTTRKLEGRILIDWIQQREK